MEPPGQGSAPFSSTLQLPKGARDDEKQNKLEQQSQTATERREIKYLNGLSICPSQQSLLLPLHLISTFL